MLNGKSFSVASLGSWSACPPVAVCIVRRSAMLCIWNLCGGASCCRWSLALLECFCIEWRCIMRTGCAFCFLLPGCAKYVRILLCERYAYVSSARPTICQFIICVCVGIFTCEWACVRVRMPLHILFKLLAIVLFHLPLLWIWFWIFFPFVRSFCSYFLWF